MKEKQVCWKHLFMSLLLLTACLLLYSSQSRAAETGGTSQFIENDSYFNHYIDQELMKALPSKGQNSIHAYKGESLNEIEAAIYEKLEDHIAKLASGEKTSTILDIDIDDLGVKTEYLLTDEELLPFIYSDLYDPDKDLEENLCALRYYLINHTRILLKLIAEHPYELYWYDKSASANDSQNFASMYSSCEIMQLNTASDNSDDSNDSGDSDDSDDSGDSDNSNSSDDSDSSDDAGGIALFGSVQFRFPVSKEYSQEKKTGTYEIDPSSGQLVQTAVENAKKIVKTYQSSSDTNKLKGYGLSICNLVSYSEETRTLAGSDDYEYGNPWQLIWVFDQDPSTNVVCEGYAKAFQYLCDLTTFTDNISCITVSGCVSDGQAASDHMWNLVTLKNKRNYLVDLTHCDGDTPALQPFLASYLNTWNDSRGTWYRYAYGSGTLSYQYDEDSQIIYTDGELTPSSTLVSGIRLTGISHKIAAGKKIKLTATISPSSATNKKLTWSSSNKKVATVNNGLVTFLKNSGGKSVTITAAAQDGSGIKATFVIKSMKGAVKKIKIKKKSGSLKAGKSMKLKAKVTSGKNANKTLTWSSSNKKYASVASNGTVKALKAGKGKTITITARATDGSGKSASVKIKIK